MPIDLAGKPIAITGASSGIGLATALACARAGMPVALAARRDDRLADAVARITAAGGRAIAVRVDVDNPADCKALIDRTVSEFGSIYAVFANAGYGINGPIAFTPEPDLRAIFETNFWGTLSTIRPALDRMLEAKSGHVLICSSCLSKLAVPYQAAYSATKAAQDHLGRGMRLELAGTGVHVSTVHPIGTRTEFGDVARARSESQPAAVRTPDFLSQPPETVARAIVSCLRRPRGEVWTSVPVRLAFALATALPGLANAVLGRMAAKKRANFAISSGRPGRAP